MAAGAANGRNGKNGAVHGFNGLSGDISTGYAGHYEAQMFEDPGVNAFVQDYDRSWAGMGPELPGDEPQVQWWMHKFDERAASTGAKRMRCVGSLMPTNLAPMQPKAARSKAREQRVKHQEASGIPVVTQPLRPPCDMGLAITLAKLQESDVPGIADVQQVVHASFINAYESVVTAAEAYEELCKKTEKLKNNAAAVERVKRAKVVGRDVLLWRWWGLTAWIYNQAESEFFQSYGREIESQLMNSVAKIRQRLMQNLMQRPAFKKLQAQLVRHAAADSMTPELQGLLDRFKYMHEHLCGKKNKKLDEFRVLEDVVKSRFQMALEEEKEREEEQIFAKEVGEFHGQRIAFSAVDFLAIEEEEDDVQSFPGNDSDDDDSFMALAVARSFHPGPFLQAHELMGDSCHSLFHQVVVNLARSRGTEASEDTHQSGAHHISEDQMEFGHKGKKRR